MPNIELTGITNYICRDIALNVRDGEFLVLLGPNGSGKTTLLNVIAGLAKYRGSVTFDGIPVDTVPPRMRRIGYISQGLALFPHMTVAANITFGLHARRKDPRAISRRVRDMMEMVRIAHLADRHPGTLSGGEQQRVALARALAPEPDVFLLDEPFAKLDVMITKHLRIELKSLQRKLGTTTIYVTHNHREAEELGDRIAVLNEGKLIQAGTPEEIFFEPHNDDVSEFIGSPNVFHCDHSKKIVTGLAETTCGGMTIVVPSDDGYAIKKVAILPRDVYISKANPPGPELNRYTGRIIDITASPHLTRIRVQIEGHVLVSETPTETMGQLGLSPGETVHLILKLNRLKTLSERNNDSSHRVREQVPAVNRTSPGRQA